MWEGAQVIGEHDATTPLPGYGEPPYQEQSARLDYVYAGAKMIQSRERASSTGTWTTRYFLSDRLSLRMTLDGGGNVLGQQAHLPFGEHFGESGTQEKHHFTSYEKDSESGLDYAINRAHSAVVGRFLQADQYRASGYMVDPRSWNRYSYTRNEPVNRVDPLGLEDVDVETLLVYPEEYRSMVMGPSVPGVTVNCGMERVEREVERRLPVARSDLVRLGRLLVSTRPKE